MAQMQSRQPSEQIRVIWGSTLKIERIGLTMTNNQAAGIQPS